MEDIVPSTSAPPVLQSPSVPKVQSEMKSPNTSQYVGSIVNETKDQQLSRLNNNNNNLEIQPEDRLLTHHDGVGLILEHAKMWSKYAKDLLCYLEKRTQIEVEYHRSIVKNAQNLKASLSEEVCFS